MVQLARTSVLPYWRWFYWGLPTLRAVSAQPIPGPGERPLPGDPIGPSEQGPPQGGRRLVPHDNPNRPSIDFTIEPGDVYPGDRVTLRWLVRSQNLTERWTDPVGINALHLSLPAALLESAGSSGSYSFTALPDREHDEFTLLTGRGLYAAQQKVEYRLIEAPVVSRISVLDDRTHDFRDTDHGFAGDTVAIDGSSFGFERGDGQVSLVQGGETFRMAVEAWTDTRIVARVPSDAAVKRGHIIVGKGGSRLRIDGDHSPSRGCGTTNWPALARAMTPTAVASATIQAACCPGRSDSRLGYHGAHQ